MMIPAKFDGSGEGWKDPLESSQTGAPNESVSELTSLRNWSKRTTDRVGCRRVTINELRSAMTRREFKKIVVRVMETLPKEFEPYLNNVVVEVADEPDDELLHKAGYTDEEIDDGESLLGFFDPLELPSAWASDVIDTHDMMHRLWIFKLPHEEEYPDPTRLRTEIRKTVIHELAHHFGYTDRDLERFDSLPDPFGDGWDADK